MTLPGSRRVDVLHSGGPRPTPAEEAAVLAVLARHVGPENAAPTPDLCEEAGVTGGPFRATMSAHDGVDFLIGRIPGEGIFVAETPEQAEAFTLEMEKHAASVLERVRRRRTYVPPEELPF